MAQLSKASDHIITKMDPREYVDFVCPAQPKMELRSYQLPRLCPVCRRTDPIKMGVIEISDQPDVDRLNAQPEFDEPNWVTL